MFSSVEPAVLRRERSLFARERVRTTSRTPGNCRAGFEAKADRPPFLRIPPFPGANAECFRERATSETYPVNLASHVRRFRVGGTYWGAQPQLPSRYVLVCSRDVSGAANRFPDSELVIWNPGGDHAPIASPYAVADECDAWHMLSNATAIVLNSGDDLRLIAALLEVPCYIDDPVSGHFELDRTETADLLRTALGGREYVNPFTDEPISVLKAVELCGFWRRLIESNRDLAGGLGFALWKQSHVSPLLWSGGAAFKFLRSSRAVAAGSRVAVWRSRAPDEAVRDIERKSVRIVEVEDGFLRSRGLGSDCVPPLSITVDRIGVHFDPSSPSELENLLQNGQFDEQLLSRARELRELIVDAGIGKYELGHAPVEPRVIGRRQILVPGQVADDRSVQSGGCGLVCNLELLKRVRDQAPDACIVYKPHPDVLAGHRRGAIPQRACLQYADRVVSDVPIASLISSVDEIHVNTSLAGFEALLRRKAVTTYGVPFYAGWGLTRDLGPVPQRRTARRSLDELVAATLLLYPRYLDPITGLPCPAEVVVKRLAAADVPDAGILVRMRRLQGRLVRRFRNLGQ